MTLTANQALVLPKNYVSINETEMEYVDGGKTVCIWESAGSIKNRLNTIIWASIVGQASAVAMGLCTGGIIGGVAAFFIGDAWFGNIRSLANSAHAQVESIINKYGSNHYCCLQSTWSTINCTSITVS